MDYQVVIDAGHGGYSYTRCTLKIKLKHYNTRAFELFLYNVQA